MVMPKNVDSLINNMTNEDLARHINPKLKVKKVIKTPNSSHLLKIIFNTAETVDKAVA